MPVAIAPVGSTGMQHADGEILAARAAEKFGILFTLSTMSICSIEDIATHTSAPFWFQLYMMRDREAMERMIQRARDARCSALVLTLTCRSSASATGTSERPDRAAQPTLGQPDQPGDQAALVPGACWAPGGTASVTWWAKAVTDMKSLAAVDQRAVRPPRLSWADVAWVKERWGGKLILKGIMDVEDAPWRWPPGPTPSWSATMAGASWTVRPPASPRCRPSWPRWPEDRGLDGRRHPQRQDVLRAWALGARHHDRPRHGLRPGRHGRSRRLRAADPPRNWVTMAFCGHTNIPTSTAPSSCPAPSEGCARPPHPHDAGSRAVSLPDAAPGPGSRWSSGPAFAQTVRKRGAALAGRQPGHAGGDAGARLPLQPCPSRWPGCWSCRRQRRGGAAPFDALRRPG